MTTLSEIKDICEKKDHIDTTWRRKISYPIALVLIKLKFTGNQVSAFGLTIGMISCIFFIIGNKTCFVIGGMMLFLSQIMDYCDGEVARYRTVKGLPDELWRNRGGAFDSLNHIAPTPALICMGFGLMESTNYPILIITIGFVAGLFQFIRGGFFSYLSFILKLMGKKFVDKKPKIIRPLNLLLPHMPLSFLVPHMIWLSLIIAILALLDIFVNKNLILITFVVISFLIFIQGSIKVIAKFPKIESIKGK